jgi:Zn finger protein HypA/HybF involved in hydrogenase expression
MTEIAALEKHPCAACGAQAEWNPSKQKLVCPFCGTETPYVIDKDTGKVQELDLVSALRSLPDEQRGWQTERRSVQCQSCKAVMVYDPARVGQNCEFCGSPALVDYQEIKSPIRPQSLLPFKVAQAQVRERMRDWYRGRWFAPGALQSKALVDQIKGMYVPYWTFDAQADCPWRAEAGYYYYVQEEYRDSNGKAQVRQARRVRWEPASGRVSHFFDDDPVSGSRGIDAGLLKSIEPFPTKELVPYDTAYLSGYVVEHYQVVLVDAAKQARAEMHQELLRLCSREVPGDTQRNLEISPTFSAETFKHILVPVWLLTYTYGRRVFQVVANGYTGTIEGHYPKSPWKMAAAAFVLIAVVIIFLFLAQQR